jgi:hypothetical protein
MALIILEGLDRTGKSSVAEMFQKQGFDIVHMSAPPKEMQRDGYAGPSYLEMMVDMLGELQGRDVVLDRSHYGELIWPQVYGRKALLSDEDVEYLREIENNMDTTRILMHDPNNEAHWQRCVDNKEPLTKPQFVKARSLYSALADKYGFDRKTLKDFPDAEQPLPSNGNNKGSKSADASKIVSETSDSSSETSGDKDKNLSKTKEQLKLEKANVINEVLEKRIIKGKGAMYDDVERSVRHFLNGELGKILGTSSPSVSGFSNEEMELLKFFCKRLKDKEN